MSFYSLRVVLDAILIPLFFKKIVDVLADSGLTLYSARQEIFELLVLIVALNAVSVIIVWMGKFIFMDF